jgi:hypothetical protein
VTVLSGGGDLVDVDRFGTLKLLFEIVREDGWVSAKAIGRKFPDGKRAANSDLYRFEGVLFKKRGFAPPEWSVVGDDAFDRWLAAIESPVQSAESQREIKESGSSSSSDSTEITMRSEAEPRRLFQGVEKEWPRIERDEIPDVQVCNSCERPVKANGTCGCS